MVDFIEQVEEQLRSERYLALAKRLLPWFIAALAAVIIGWLGFWGYRSWQNRNIGAASIVYDKGIQDLAQNDASGAWAQFNSLAKGAPAGYHSLALMDEGDIRLAAGKNAEAADLFDQSAKAAPGEVIHDLAALKAALALMDSAPYPQLHTRLSALIGDKKPFSLQAREALAMAKLAAGKTAEAKNDFEAITLTLGASDPMKARAEAAIGLIDAGEAGLVSKAAHTSATLPPSARTTIGGASDPGASGASGQTSRAGGPAS
ncbi:MAG: tetratricopeptide repeat protein [Caulobacteraceae bacterium]